MSFIAYDLAFLVLFTIGVVIFLYTRKHNLQRQGILYLYRTKLGIRLMDWTVDNFGWFLRPLQYVVVASGFILMALMLWLLGRSAYDYITSPVIAELIKAPPVAPLIPYFPALFNLESYFPPLYFTYFLIALIIVAVSHEFSHGIFARLNKIKVQTTGFAFLGPILGAFVEPDEKQMQKAPKFQQMSILAAGTFANVIMTVIFGGIMLLFFSLSFSPAGVVFNTYATTQVPFGEVSSVNGISIGDVVASDIANEELVNVELNDGSSYLTPGVTMALAIEQGSENLPVYEDAPAVRARLKGAITEFDGVKIASFMDLQEVIADHSPGDNVEIKTIGDDGENLYDIELGDKDGNAYLGIGVIQPQRNLLAGLLMSQVEKVKDPFVYYEPNWNGDLAWFVYYLLWWVVVINILVALFNMLPVSILDGGRFLYLTVWGITGRESWGKKSFKFMTWLILLLLLAMMIRWVFVFF